MQRVLQPFDGRDGLTLGASQGIEVRQHLVLGGRVVAVAQLVDAGRGLIEKALLDRTTRARASSRPTITPANVGCTPAIYAPDQTSSPGMTYASGAELRASSWRR